MRLPLEMLLPLMRARRSILVGDHRQLPPLFQEGADAQTFSDVVEEAEQDEQESRTALTRQNLHRFEKMVTASLFKSHFEAADDAIRARLEVQFRMHPQIMTMVNHFYERRLTCGLEFPNYDRNHGLVLVDADGKSIVKPALDGGGNRIPKNISFPGSCGNCECQSASLNLQSWACAVARNSSPESREGLKASDRG